MYDPIVTSNGKVYQVDLCKLEHALGRRLLMRLVTPEGQRLSFQVIFPLSYMATHGLPLDTTDSENFIRRARKEIVALLEENNSDHIIEAETVADGHRIRCQQ